MVLYCYYQTLRYLVKCMLHPLSNLKSQLNCHMRHFLEMWAASVFKIGKQGLLSSWIFGSEAEC